MAREWVSELLGAECMGRLAEQLSGSELQSVSLEVMERRAASRRLS